MLAGRRGVREDLSGQCIGTAVPYAVPYVFSFECRGVRTSSDRYGLST